MKVKILHIPPQPLADTKAGDIGELVTFVRAADDRAYAVVVLDKNNRFDFIDIYNIERVQS